MRSSLRLALSVGLALGMVTARAQADVWDVQTNSDNAAATTHNELMHGGDQIHDLGALAGGTLPDQDWFRISQKAFSSYEAVADATSGDIGNSLNLERIGADGTTVVQSSAAVGVGYSRSLRWANSTATAVDDQYIRVTSAACTTNCGPDDVYRIRFYETTLAGPRFNNAGSQITIILLQNPTTYTITGNIYFWSEAGTLIAPSSFTLVPRQLLVLNTATIAPGIGGTLILAHDAQFGDLTGKAIALEPATGFSFDSPLVARLH